MAGGLIGGEFKHNTTHTVAVAKVIDGQVVVSEVDGKWLVNVMKSDLD